MYQIDRKNRFDKNLKKSAKRGKDVEKLFNVVDLLQRGETLPPRYKAHKLKGDYTGYWECHIEPDWLLVYKIENDILYLVDLGSHSDLSG